MKTIKFLTMAAAALMMAACSSDELESVAKKAGGMVPLEIVPDVSNQTRAAQITAENLDAFTVDVTGTFVDAGGTEYTNPVLSMTKSGGDWSYSYTDATHATPADGTLYWPLEGQTATFSAHIVDASATVDEKAAQQDVVGAYASKTFDGTDNPGAVSLTFKHAVAKMQFKARVEAASGTVQATIDIKQVAVRHTLYSGTYAIPTSTNETGVLTAGTDKDDLFTDMRTGTAFLSKDDAAATDLGSVFMLPQSVTADALGTTPWNDAYIAVLAQVRIKDGSADETMLFPNVGAVNTTDYAWLAVPMPAEFTAMEAHHKYVFTLHFSADALGKIDPTQDPYAPDPNNPDETIDPDDPNDPNGGFINPDDEGQDIVPEGKSANPVTVTVQNIYDFEEDGNNVFDVNKTAATVTAVPAATTGDIVAGTTTPLITAGEATDGTMMYAVTATNTKPASTEGFSATVPTAESIAEGGTYYVWYYVKGDDAHNDSEISAEAIPVTVQSPAATVTTSPAATTGDIVAGTTTPLITAGVATGGTMMYAVTSTNTKPTTTEGFSATVPTAESIAVAGTYYVWYYVKGDDSHNDSEISAVAIPVTVQPAGVDLSMVDCVGNARASMWTANCYMVHTAGNYKLPLVYGNAIKNGAANTVAYNPGGSTSTTYCANFVNHAGNAINAPWITKSTSGTGVNKGMGINVTQAELLWQDAQGLITKVGISGDYLTLTVGKNATTQEGNAVIAVKSGNTIVWSWHIWVTKQTFATLTTITASGYGYKVTPVNLGWVGDATSAIGGYNTYYQWGRKDAFIPSNPIPSTGTDNTNHTVYNISNATVTGITHTDDNSMTISGNIQHPTVHYQNTSTYGPCDSRYYNMWDAQQTSTGIAAAATKKTVYDPCPPGFCVPTSGLYNYIASQTVPAFNKGCTYSGVFFPASGFRFYNSGDLISVGTYDYYWSATPYSGAHGRNFDFSSSGWYLSSNYRANGFPVRAVAE